MKITQILVFIAVTFSIMFTGCDDTKSKNEESTQKLTVENNTGFDIYGVWIRFGLTGWGNNILANKISEWHF